MMDLAVFDLWLGLDDPRGVFEFDFFASNSFHNTSSM